MVKKEFNAYSGYLHIPVRGCAPELAYYIDTEADGQWKNEFLIAVCPPGERFDFYVALDMKRYHCRTVTLLCKDDSAPENLFDAIIPGGSMLERPELYPNLYREQNRQQIHFSPARGWLNDPNGLFYKDGVFNMYFQHNPFATHHFGTNVSWGHAVSTDGVHYMEVGDAIMPKNSLVSIASGSALVDIHNISGLGKDTVLAAYSDLESTQYHGRPKVTSGGGQNLLYSTDNGMTYHYFPNNPIIPVPDYENWRDPKLIQLDEHTFCVAVYETYEGKDCVSFYKSTDCVQWTFCSRSMDLFECPDLFLLRVTETDEPMWVLYGGNGKYRVGQFENFEFNSNGSEGYLDYGDCIYAGQTFNNYDDPHARLHLAWMRDHEKPWDYADDELYKTDGFSQSMSLMCRLSLHKTDAGYRLFRTPIGSLAALRESSRQIVLDGPVSLPVPGEIEFRLDGGTDASVFIGSVGFRYDARSKTIATSSGKEYRLCSPGDISVRILADRRSAEIFVAGQISMSFFVKPAEEALVVENSGSLTATVYFLRSIWE